MILRLSLRAQRGLLLAAFAALCFLSYFSIRVARAAHAAGLNTRAGYEHAVRLEPSDPRNWYLLGRFYQYDFEQSDPNAALNALLVARSLDPLSADTLLDLAANYDEAGKTAEARASYLEAKRVYPLSSEVLWRYGNFLLRNNEIDAAFPEIRKAVELDPKRGPEAFSRCHRVVPDVNEILDRVIPRNFQIYVYILLDSTSSAQFDLALQVWQRAKILPGTVNLTELTPLANALVQSNRMEEAVRFWQEAAAKIAVPIPPDAPGSILWDGGFESGFFGGGLSWHFPPNENGVQIKPDQREKHSGAQSLQIAFSGRSNVYFAELCHWAPIDSGKTYRLSAWVKTKALTTDEGIRFGIFSRVAGRAETILTNDVHGDQPWTNLALTWTAPVSDSPTQVCAVRSQSALQDGDIAGIAWIDDVTLTPVAAPVPSSEAAGPNNR
ncbi:MAG: carbohydrate binding domain-containing protein [Acidobacteria bacterium]|nr:carbohydrate binding domain-containing protein [Acidobacteriota bacterium]MBS1865495.1 carbohydrate binding domain-containing protein [Acidobacteriota bacterium]